MMNRIVLIGRITQSIITVCLFATMQAGQRFTDAATGLEDLFADLLNAMYGLSLKNANVESRNQHAVDLVDATNGVAVQVTIQTSRAKLQKTIDTFLKGNLQKSYPRLWVVVAGDLNLRRRPIAPSSGAKFAFERIIDIKHVLSDIPGYTLSQLQKIDALLRDHFEHVQPGQLLEMAEKLDTLDQRVNSLDQFAKSMKEGTILLDEIGENSNGHYVIYNDQTLVCSGATVVTDIKSLSRDQNVTFPAAYGGIPTVFATVNGVPVKPTMVYTTGFTVSLHHFPAEVVFQVFGSRVETPSEEG